MSEATSHRGDIEGLRALAVGLVLAYHAQLPMFAGGFLGVDVFFVISGFLITSSLLREVGRTQRIRLGAFYARRARRLLPASALVLLATAVGVRVLLPATTWRDFGGDIAAAGGYVVNWRLALRSVDYLAEDVVTSPVQHFWSLSIEEQFYVVWPLLLIAAAGLAKRRGWSVRAVSGTMLAGLVVLPSLVWSVVVTAGDPALAFFDLRTRMWELGIGGLVSVLAVKARRPRGYDVVLKGASLVVLVVLGVLLDERAPWPGATAMAAVLPTAVLLWLGGHGDAVDRLLSLRPLQRVGAWSYSLYLWHWPPLAILAARWDGLTTREAVLIVLASVPFAVLSHHFVENPVRYAAGLKGRTGRTLRLGGALTAGGLVAGIALVAAVPAGPGTTLVLDEPAAPAASPSPGVADVVIAAVEGPVGAGALAGLELPVEVGVVEAMLAAVREITPAPTAAVDDLPKVYADRCQIPFLEVEPKLCAYGDPDGEVHVALVGDSKAGQWGDTLELLAQQQGWRLTYLMKSTCELTTAMPLREGPDVPCRDWGQRVLQLLTDDPPDVVLTSQISGTAYAEEGQDAVALQVEGMLDAYAQLEAAGSRVVLLMDNRNPGMNVYECVSEHLDELAACSFAADRGSPSRGTQMMVAEAGGFAVVDLADEICPSLMCPPVIGNVLVYRQGSHVTNTYAVSLLPMLDAKLTPLVEETVAR